MGSGITRKAISALVEQGLHSPQALVEASAGVLELWLSPEEVKLVKGNASKLVHKTVTAQEGANAQQASKQQSIAPVLVVDETRPGEIILDGQTIRLQDKQYQMIHLLTEEVGRCVGYDAIYDTLWGDTIVEQNQIHFQKRKLKKAIEAVLPARGDMIKTVPKRGFSLCLGAHEVYVRKIKSTQEVIC